MSNEPTNGIAQRAKFPVYTFHIKRKSGSYDEVNSCFVEFTPHHVIFRNEEGHIDYGLHASEIIDIVQEEQ